jgi:hypothetical protein
MLTPVPWTRWSMIATVLEQWHLWMRAGSERSERERVGPGRVAQEVSGLEIPAYDVNLMFRRMSMLHIDQDELAGDDPLQFRELQARCILCHSRGRCASDLAHEFDDVAWQDWRDYCPNATTLSVLGALQGCHSATQRCPG